MALDTLSNRLADAGRSDDSAAGAAVPSVEDGARAPPGWARHSATMRASSSAGIWWAQPRGVELRSTSAAVPLAAT